MELREGVSVYSAGGEELGKVNRFILDPSTGKVTHLTVQKGWLFPEDRVLPMHRVASATEERVVLRDHLEDIKQLPPFEETHYVGLESGESRPEDYPPANYAPAFYWYPPYGSLTGFPASGVGGAPIPFAPAETERNIPENTVPIREGVRVRSAEGEHVGDVERVLVDPESSRVTHFLISRGLIFKERKVIPQHWVRQLDEEELHLGVPRTVLERLPDYQE